MSWGIVSALLENHGIYMLAIVAIGWAYWQERKENRDAAKADKEESKQMITALLEVRDALRSFKETLESRSGRR